MRRCLYVGRESVPSGLKTDRAETMRGSLAASCRIRSV